MIDAAENRMPSSLTSTTNARHMKKNRMKRKQTHGAYLGGLAPWSQLEVKEILY